MENFFIQPIVDLATRQVCGGEVLWFPDGAPPRSEQLQTQESDPALNILVAQDAFIYALRALDRIQSTTWLSVKISCQYIGSHKMFFRPISKAVGDLDSARRRIGKRLIIETTGMQSSGHNQIAFINEIISLNSLAIDYFGKDDILLSQIMALKFSKAKVDRSVVSGVDSDSAQQRALKWLVAGCHAIDVDVCAEGIETESEATFLRSIGVDQGQGLLWSPAVSFEAFEELCSSQGRERPQPTAKPQSSPPPQTVGSGLLIADC